MSRLAAIAVAAPMQIAAAILLMSTPDSAQAEIPSFIPEVEIAKSTVEHEWPFTVERGDLACLEISNQRFVFFSEKPKSEELADIVERRTVIVSTNPLSLFVSYEDRALYAPFKDMETLIKRLAPYEAMGTKLCDDAKAKKEN